MLHVATFFFSSRRRHTRLQGDWSSDVCSSDLWLKNRSAEAIRVTVADVPMPDGNALLKATSVIRQDATIGGRMSRKQYDQAVAARDQERSDEAPDLATALTRKYQSTRERGP